MPTLSIVIPVYNLERYLKKCLDSVIIQNSEEVEILLLDDGSTDGSGQICDEYARRYDNIKVYHKENEGLSATRNLGIRRAEGEYILFLDGDDFLTPNAVRNIINELKSGLRADVLIGRYISYSSSTGIMEECGYHLDKQVVEGAVKEKLFRELLSGKTYDWYACLNIVRKGYIVENAIFFKEGVCFEDAMWTPEVLFHAERAAYLDTPFYVYRQNREGSITASVDENTYMDKLYVCRYAEEFCRRYRLSKEMKRQFMGNYNSIYAALLADSWRLDKSRRKEIWGQLICYRKILLYSEKGYQTYLYKLWNMLGIGGISYVLHLRAEWVRRKT